MAYVKLDTGILNSTLWVDRECREVFITALLMAEPFEAIEPLTTYAVRTLDPMPFEVPPGWYGFVRAAGVGIVRFAMAEPEPGMLALERLAAPDPESRSQDFEGRRLVRVDGGYIVLNFFKYRDRDHTAATRSKRYRERLKAGSVTRDDADDTRNVTQAGSSNIKQEAEADTDTTHSAKFIRLEHTVVYEAIRAEAKSPVSFDAMLATLHEPISGGAAYDWKTIGQALLDLRANGSVVSANSIRAFCRKLTQPEQPNGKRPNKLTEGRANLSAWVEKSEHGN